jgi:opacity protein-like surface antigen
METNALSPPTPTGGSGGSGSGSSGSSGSGSSGSGSSGSGSSSATDDVTNGGNGADGGNNLDLTNFAVPETYVGILLRFPLTGSEFGKTEQSLSKAAIATVSGASVGDVYILSMIEFMSRRTTARNLLSTSLEVSFLFHLKLYRIFWAWSMPSPLVASKY